MPLGIEALPEHERAHDRLRPEHPRPTEALGPGQRRLDVGHLDVERDVAAVALRAAGDPPADADAVAVEVAVALHQAVAHVVVGVDLPVEQLTVERPQLVAILADHLEMDDRLSHDRSLPRRQGPAHRMAATYG